MTNSDHNKFRIDIIDAKIKQKILVNKCNISNLVKNYELTTKFETFATKTELKAEQDKRVKIQTHDLNYFLGKTLLVMIILSICLFMSQHLVRYR